MPSTFLQSVARLKRVYPYVRPYRGRIAIGIVCVMIHGIASMQVPRLLRHSVDYLQHDSSKLGQWQSDPLLRAIMHTALPLLRREVSIDQLDVSVFAIGILLVALVGALALFGGRYAIISASRLAERGMRQAFFDHLQRLTPSFYHQNRTGDLMTRAASDTEQVRMLLGPGIMYPAQTLWIVILVLGYMFSRDSGLALLVLIPIAILCVYVNYWTRIMHRLSQRAQETYSTLSSHVQETLSGIRVVKAYLQEDAEAKRFQAINQDYLEHNLAMVDVRAKAWPLLNFIGGLGLVILFFAGGEKVIAGQMTNGELWQYILYYLMLFWPMIAFGWIMNVIYRGTVSWQRIDNILLTEPMVHDSHGTHDVVLGPPAIIIRDLTFTYPGIERPVLCDIDLSVEAGGTVAVVGPTGCGKSTLVNLLLHLYPVESGRIFVAGHDITRMPLRRLREQIAYVSQDVFLFSDSIRENILFGLAHDNGSPAELERMMLEASRVAQLDPDVQTFPDGYDTELGERGITLSGGQRQRLGIARALILKRPILLLDDCLSAVDTHTEELLLQGLRREMGGRTTILISHRISTVKNADAIVVLDEGRIVERGMHHELIEMDGLYASMYQRQLLEESLGIRS